MAKKRGLIEKCLLTLAFLKAKVDFGNLMQSNVINLHEINKQKWNSRLTSYRQFSMKIFCPSKYLQNPLTISTSVSDRCQKF